MVLQKQAFSIDRIIVLIFEMKRKRQLIGTAIIDFLSVPFISVIGLFAIPLYFNFINNNTAITIKVHLIQSKASVTSGGVTISMSWLTSTLTGVPTIPSIIPVAILRSCGASVRHLGDGWAAAAGGRRHVWHAGHHAGIAGHGVRVARAS